jgi:hypothetical protein
VQKVERWRNRLNTAILVLPGQWLGLMGFYWLRFYPPFRPSVFETEFPPLPLFISGCIVSLVPFLLPMRYFSPFEFERGEFYPRLGLRWFRYIAPDGDLVKRILRRMQPGYRIINNHASLREHIAGTYSNERWHSSFFIAGILTSIHAMITAQYVLGLLIIITNACFNMFPVMHQRYKRARIRRLNPGLGSAVQG